MTQKIAPIPKGFRTITPCLTVAGAAEAIEFYKRAFGAEEQSRLYDADGVRIVHAALKVGNSVLFLTEVNPGANVFSPLELGYSSALVHLYVEDADELWSKALAAGAMEIVPLADTYWGDRFGKLVDPFGHYWSIATRVEKVSPEELVERTRAAALPTVTTPAGDSDSLAA